MHLIMNITAPLNNLWTLKFKAQATNAFYATVNHVQQLLSASNYWKAQCNQIAEHNSDNETVFGSSRKLGFGLAVVKDTFVG